MYALALHTYIKVGWRVRPIPDSGVLKKPLRPRGSEFQRFQLCVADFAAAGPASSFGIYSPPGPRSHVRSSTFSGLFCRNVSAM